MITLPKELGEYMPGILGILFAMGMWIVMTREHRKVVARYFAKYGRYPGEPAPKHEPAE